MPELEKNKSQKIDNKKIILTFFILIALIFAIVLFFKAINKSLIVDVYAPIPESSMEVGTVGFLDEGQKIEDVNPEAVERPVRPLDMPVPRDIFNTSGIIIAIQANSIVIRGAGTNFDDQIKRDLVVVIDEATTVNGVKGNLDFFKTNLKIGNEVVVEASYNIHGKTEFLAKYINRIKD